MKQVSRPSKSEVRTEASAKDRKDVRRRGRSLKNSGTYGTVNPHSPTILIFDGKWIVHHDVKRIYIYQGKLNIVPGSKVHK
jgi:hypothetical protein